VVCVDRACVRPLGRFPMSVECSPADLVRKLLAFRLKINLDPADVVLSLVGMGDLLAHADRHFKKLSFFDGCRRVNHRNMLFSLPVCCLIKRFEICHKNSFCSVAVTLRWWRRSQRLRHLELRERYYFSAERNTARPAKGGTGCSAPFAARGGKMVELAGIEPASSNGLTKAATCLVYSLVSAATLQ
jgi:hypothetical protein